MDQLSMASKFSPKSFWERTEGTFGMVTLAALILGAGYGAYLLLPFIITLLQNLLTASLLFVAVACVFYLLSQKRFWTLLSGTFKLLMRKATSIFITIDPIGILKDYLGTLRKNLENIDNQIANLSGQKRQLQNTIEQNKRTRQQALTMAKVAKEKGKTANFVLSARSAGRLKESNVTLEQLLTKLEVLYRILQKMKDASNFMYEDIKDQVKTLEIQKKSIDTGYSAFRSAMKFISDSSDDKALYDETVEYLVADYGQKLGEIEHFMDVAKPFIEGVDLQNLAFEEDALRDLEAWEKQADNLLLGGDDKTFALLTAGSELTPFLNNVQDAQFQEVMVSNEKQTNKYLKTNRG